MKMKILFATLLTLGVTLACSDDSEFPYRLEPANFATEVNGKPVALYTLKNSAGMEAAITNYGGRIAALKVRDKNGRLRDVVLGYDNIADYLAADGNYGALIGRYGNRIANAAFTLDCVDYSLPKNDGNNCLHGGPQGFDKRVWDAQQTDSQTLELTYLSADGEAGFPGNLSVKVTYKLTNDNAIDIQYEATTDKPTVVNLTNHSYFNLTGVVGFPTLETILNHQVQINADNFTPVNETMIPTGDFLPVAETPLDFRQLTTIGDRIDNPYQQLVIGHGYDHNWVLNNRGNISAVAAKAFSPTSGIVLEVFTSEPGIQLYTGNYMVDDTGKYGVIYPHRGALCLETQHYPDSPNHPAFPPTELWPGQTYTSRCIYKFSVQSVQPN